MFKKFVLNPEISEIAGFFAADGSMQKDHISFWGNPSADKDYYDFHLRGLFLKSFNISINPHEKKSNSVYGFYVCDKNIISFFNEYLGFPIGKKTYSLEVPKVIYQNDNKKISKSFIRGFFAGDGCLNFDKRYGNYKPLLKKLHTYPRIQIRSVSQKAIYQLSDMILNLGIPNFVAKKPSKNKHWVDSYMLQVSGEGSLLKLKRCIGFSNPNHSSRYEMFKKYGFVPSNTSYHERIRMLKGELNPCLFYGPVA